MERFVKQGADVIVHPNICVAYRSFEYAATTNPEVVGTIVRLCLKAGAKRVRVMDSPFGGTPEEVNEISGIGAAVRAAGGEMEFMPQPSLPRPKSRTGGTSLPGRSARTL